MTSIPKSLYILCSAFITGTAATIAFAEDVAADKERLHEIVDNTESPVVAGEDGWLFLKGGIASYAKPSIWPRDDASGESPAEVITGFAGMLNSAGIDLIVVPVPGKVAIYPDKAAGLPPEALANGTHEAFIKQLQSNGVEVIDLAPRYRQMREQGKHPYAKQDSHWSPAGMEAAVKAVADKLEAADWFAGSDKGKSTTRETTVEALGDLVTLGKLEGYAPETFQLREVQVEEGAVDDASSPVVLIGDSHLLVYHQPINGGIEASGAGFPDRLFALTGLSSDLVANQGGGANVPRARLARRRGEEANLAGKKAVVWVFASRDLTEESSGWVPIPVIR